MMHSTQHLASKIILSTLATVALLPLASCMKDEPLNAECDIEQVVLHCPQPHLVFYNLTDTARTILYTDSIVTYNVRPQAPLNEIVPQFKTTTGAKVEDLGIERNELENSVQYRYKVTSQDGKWHRGYTLVFKSVTVNVSDTVNFDLENYELDPATQKYYIWHNILDDGTMGNNWATGNPGFKISMSSAKPEAYPSVPEKNGMDGACIKLTTRDTGPFGAMANKRLAAGNLFLGEFDVSSAMRNALQATRFGIPFNKRPIKLTGYYKYAPGAKFQNKAGKEVAGKVDSAAIYSVFYDNHDVQGNPVVLHGDDVTTHGNIVAIAQVGEIKHTQQWTQFEATFIYSKDVDPQKLKNMGYNMTIVCSSSKEGASFEGAIGSELMVDKIRLICTKEK